MRVNVTSEAQLASAFGKVDQVPLGAYQPVAWINEQECAASEADALMPPPF
jgi:hypothetical protein